MNRVWCCQSNVLLASFFLLTKSVQSSEKRMSGVFIMISNVHSTLLSKVVDLLANGFPHSKKKGTSKPLFWCFRLSQIWTPRCLSWSFQIPFGPSRHWIEFSICDNLKHQKRCLEVLFFLECVWCGEARLLLFQSAPSNDFPQGPLPIF